ncbi:MAG: CHAT domain-containing protein, partial [Bacteroidota bacterium]
IKHHHKTLLYTSIPIESIYDLAKWKLFLRKEKNPLKWIEFLTSYGETYFQYTKHFKSRSDLLIQTEKILQLTTDLLSYLQSQVWDSNTHLYAQQKAYPTFRTAIEVALELNKPEEAFKLAEMSRGGFLTAAIQRHMNTQTQGISAEVIQTEMSLLRQLKYYGNSGETESLIASRREFEEFLNMLQTTYSKYYEAKYQKYIPSVEDIQTTLSPDETLISFFGKDSSYVIFQFSQKEFKAKRLNLNAEALSKFSDIMGKGLEGDSSRASYPKLASQLYEDIWQKLPFPPTTKTIIIKDGVLGGIAFEALLSQKPIDTEFSRYSYLLYDHNITYTHSSGIWFRSRTQDHQASARKGLVAYAPLFKEVFKRKDIPEDLRAYLFHNSFTQTDPSDLPTSLEVQINVKEIFAMNESDWHEGMEALLGRFLSTAKEYQVIHLATHGNLSNEVGAEAFLEFEHIQDSLNNERLYPSQLFGMELNAELVVLSACQTFLGDYVQSEGMFSLEYGFRYAGSRSVVSTLWQVDQKYTSKFMELFYSHLFEGMSKQDAMRKAKLDMIKSTHSNPCRWAGFVLTGDTSSIDFIDPNPWYTQLKWIASMILILLIIIMSIQYWRSKITA